MILTPRKYLSNILTSLAFSSNHSLAVVALVIVSCVVNVLEAITKSVVSGSHLFNVTSRV